MVGVKETELPLRVRQEQGLSFSSPDPHLSHANPVKEMPALLP